MHFFFGAPRVGTYNSMIFFPEQQQNVKSFLLFSSLIIEQHRKEKKCSPTFQLTLSAINLNHFLIFLCALVVCLFNEENE